MTDEVQQLRMQLADHGEHISRLETTNARLRTLLREARQYVSDAGNDEDGETQTLSAALLTEIDAALERAAVI